MNRIIFCSKCGSELAKDSLYCQSCGAKIPQVVLASRTQPAYATPTQSYPYQYHRHKSNVPKIIFIILFAPGFIIAFLAAVFIVILPLISQPPYQYLGEKPELVIPLENTTSTLRLELVNNFGEISIITDPSMKSLFQGSIKVYGREDSDLVDANAFSYQTVGSIVTVEFTSDWPLDQNPFTYELVIAINQNISVELDIETHSGVVDIDFTKVDINDFDIKTITGNQNINLSQTNRFSEYIPFITSSSGRIDLFFTDINYTTTTTTWTITTSSGSIDLYMKQHIADMNNSTSRAFIINTPTGTINVNTDLSTDYGISVTATTSSGSINLPSSGDEYQTSNYNTASWKYDFEMTTSTGRINFH